jgi:hypothetical protein
MKYKYVSDTLFQRCRRKLHLQIILKWIFIFGLILSVIVNFLQLGDRIHLKKELTKLQFIGGSEDFKIEPLDTLNTLCLPHRHKK